MPRYASASEWMSDLLSDNMGQLWLEKLEFDFNNGNLSATDRSDFDALVEANLTSVASLASPLAALEFVLSRTPSLALRSRRSVPTLTTVVCIIRMEVYFYYLLDRRAFASIIDEAEDDMTFVWDNMGGLITSVFHSGRLRTDRPFFWCATADQIDAISTHSTDDKNATIIRNRLGLSHMSQGQRIVRLNIPTHLLTGLTVRPPTTLDGGINPAFVPAAESDGYGRTLNLQNLLRDLKELVVEQVEFTPEIDARKQGTVDELCPPLDLAAIVNLLR